MAVTAQQVGQAAIDSFKAPWEDAAQKIFGDKTGYLSFADFILPGSTAVTSLIDPNGSKAARKQLEAQTMLDNSARKFSSEEAEKQRAWEKMMSDTAVQRQVADYKAAGLNPWLAVQHAGLGASTPVGSTAQSSSGQASKADNKIAMAAGLIATALRMFLTKGK